MSAFSGVLRFRVLFGACQKLGQLCPVHVGVVLELAKIRVRKRGLLEKGSVPKSPFSREFRDCRDSREPPPQTLEYKAESDHCLADLEILENPQSAENKAESDHFLSNFSRDSRESR